MDASDRYWNLFNQVYAQKIFLNKVLIKNRFYEKLLNGILAISSSSAIASWAIFQVFPLLWSSIIVISQIIISLKPIIPISNNIESLENIKLSISLINLEMENKWFLIENGELNLKEIHELAIDFQNRILHLEDLHLKKVNLDGHNKLRQETINETEQYFNSMYGV